MLDVLVGKSVKNDASRIRHATELVKDLQRAIEDGLLFSQSTVMSATVPPISNRPLTGLNPGIFECLRKQMYHMADTQEAETSLASFLHELLNLSLTVHPYDPTCKIAVELTRVERKLPALGDWVEYGGGDARLAKQIGADAGVGRVVGFDKLARPRIRWFDGKKWKKPYSLFGVWPFFKSKLIVRVLFDSQAPIAFSQFLNHDMLGSDAAVPT